MEQVKIKVSTNALKDASGEVVPFVFSVERGQTIDELKAQGYNEDEIVSHVVRDENSNVGNACRAALVAAVDGGERDVAKLQAIVNDAAAAYESGERTVRTRGGAAALLGKAIKWACANAEVAAAYGAAIASDGLEKANAVVVELYNQAHPKAPKAA